MPHVVVAFYLLCLFPTFWAQPSTGSGSEGCTPSDLDYDCTTQIGEVTVHWTAGPSEGEGTVPSLSNGEVAVALSAETTGYVAVGFPEVAGQMAPANVILGFVDDDGPSITAYDISIQSITAGDASDEIGVTPTGGSEEDGVTTIEFVLDGTFTFDVDLRDMLNLNWAIGEEDDLVYHVTNRGSDTVNFAEGLLTEENAVPTETATAPAAEPELGPETPEEDEAVVVEEVEEDPEEEEAEATEQVAAEAENGASQGGCATSPLGYTCTNTIGEVTVHWTLGPAAETERVSAVADGNLAMAISAATTGWVGIGFAQSAQRMAPADVILGWVEGEDFVIRAYDVTAQNIDPDDETSQIGLTPVAGSEEGGTTTLEFLLDGTFTFPVNLEETVNVNWAVGGVDRLQVHARRDSAVINFRSGDAADNARSLKYYRAHGACMVIAWIGLAPLGLLIARNKFAFKGISEGAWFQMHRAVQILALAFMLCGLIIALAEFEDPAADEGKRHRRVGISILVIGFAQGAIPFLRPKHESPYRFIFNYVHWWMGRGAVVLGIATVFLGIDAFDVLNDDDVDNWWVTCLVILSVYFAFAFTGEWFSTYKHTEEIRQQHLKMEMPDDANPGGMA